MSISGTLVMIQQPRGDDVSYRFVAQLERTHGPNQSSDAFHVCSTYSRELHVTRTPSASIKSRERQILRTLMDSVHTIIRCSSKEVEEANGIPHDPHSRSGDASAGLQRDFGAIWEVGRRFVDEAASLEWRGFREAKLVQRYVGGTLSLACNSY